MEKLWGCLAGWDRWFQPLSATCPASPCPASTAENAAVPYPQEWTKMLSLHKTFIF